MSEEKKENNVKIKILSNSEVEIEGEISAEQFESYYKKVIVKLGKDAEMHGFRRGHVPEKVLIEKVGENSILQEMAQAALADVYPKIILEHSIEAIGRPEISITKLARKNPLGFKAKTAVLPQFELPDYKMLAKRAAEGADEKVFVEDKEVDDLILNIRKQRATTEKKSQDGAEQTRNSAEQTQNNAEGKEEKLPELTDDFVKQFGDFKTAADFKAKIKENLTAEKTHKAKEKKRIAIIDAILNKTNIILPAVLVESELDRMLARFKENIKSMGHASTSTRQAQDKSLSTGTFEEYLSQIKKTEQELREGWRKDAEKNIKTQLVLQKIAEAEKITVPEEEIQKELGHIEKHYPKTDKARARRYIEGVLLHEKVFQFLEDANKSAKT